MLSNNYVTPTSGGTSTNFYYYVDYYDADGDSPSVKNIIIDYVAHAMSLYSGSSANGTYRYGPVNLDCNSGVTYHRYSFNFNDGQGHTTCLPAGCTGFILGPDVIFSLGDAVDNTALTWSTGGNAPWFGQCDQYYWDHDAAKSGLIDHNQSTWMETTVNGPGTLSFYWKAYSEPDWDWLNFYIDNVFQHRISGLTDWQFRSYALSPGTHTLKWMYQKDGSVSSGHDCGYLDKVVFVAAPPAIQVTPASLNFDYVPVGSTKDLLLTVQEYGRRDLDGECNNRSAFQHCLRGKLQSWRRSEPGRHDPIPADVCGHTHRLGGLYRRGRCQCSGDRVYWLLWRCGSASEHDIRIRYYLQLYGYYIHYGRHRGDCQERGYSELQGTDNQPFTRV